MLRSQPTDHIYEDGYMTLLLARNVEFQHPLVVSANHNGGRIDLLFNSILASADDASGPKGQTGNVIDDRVPDFGIGVTFLEVYTLQDDGWHRDCSTEVTAEALHPEELYCVLDDLEFPTWEGWNPDFEYPRVMAVHSGVDGP